METQQSYFARTHLCLPWDMQSATCSTSRHQLKLLPLKFQKWRIEKMSVKMNAIRKIKKVLADAIDGEIILATSDVEFWRGFVYALRETNLIDEIQYSDFMDDLNYLEEYHAV